MGLLPPPPDDEDRRRASDAGSRGADGAPVTGAVQPDDPRVVGVVVPDDLRSLEAEILAVQAELGIVVPAPEPVRGLARVQRRLRSRQSSRHGLAPADRTWPPSGGLARSLLVGPVLALVLLGVAALVALLPASATDTAPRQSATVPALAAPTLPAGAVGGLLPDLVLAGPTGPVSARALRPAVLLLVPDRCGCPGLVHEVMGQVEEFPGVSAAIVGSGAADLTRLAVARDAGNGRLPVLVDAAGALADIYHGGPAGTVPTLLFVAPDGRLSSPPLVFTPGSRVEAQLLPLVLLPA